MVFNLLVPILASGVLAAPPISFGADAARAAFPAFRIEAESRPERTRAASGFLGRALRRYPTGLLGAVYVVRSLELRGQPCGGSTSPDGRSVVLALGAGGRLDEGWARMALDHEFAHVVMFRRGAAFPRAAWLAQNAPDFAYGSTSALAAIASGQTADAASPLRAEQGLLNDYAASSFDEDWACLAGKVMAGEGSFGALTGRHPRLGEKARLAAAFLRAAGVTLPR